MTDELLHETIKQLTAENAGLEATVKLLRCALFEIQGALRQALIVGPAIDDAMFIARDAFKLTENWFHVGENSWETEKKKFMENKK